MNDILRIKQIQRRFSVVSSRWALASRAFMSVFCAGACLLDFSNNMNDPISFIKYITRFSYYSLTIYLIISFFLSVAPGSDLRLGFVVFYVMLYECNLILNTIITLVYWGLLARIEIPSMPPARLAATVSMHGLNWIFIFTDMLLSKTPFLPTHILVILPIVLLYIPYTLLIHHFDGHWPYFFLDYENNPSLFAAFLVGTAIASVTLSFVFHYIHQFRDRIRNRSVNRDLPLKSMGSV